LCANVVLPLDEFGVRGHLPEDAGPAKQSPFGAELALEDGDCGGKDERNQNGDDDQHDRIGIHDGRLEFLGGPPVDADFAEVSISLRRGRNQLADDRSRTV
jgi:hypothetical protein